VPVLLARARGVMFAFFSLLFFGVLLFDWFGINAGDCYQLAPHFFFPVLPALALSGFLAGVALGPRDVNSDGQIGVTWLRSENGLRAVAAPIVLGLLFSFLCGAFAYYYVPIVVSRFSSMPFTESAVVSRIQVPVRSVTSCDRFIEFDVSQGRAQPICIERHGEIVLGVTAPESIREGDRLIVVGRRSGLGAAVDQLKRP
jgi:hypothetical protein